MSPSVPALMEVDRITAGYHGKRVVLEALSCRAEAGQIVAVIGPNGVGKSTLLRTMGGFIKPVQGRVLLNNRPLESLSARERARSIAGVPQNMQLPVPYLVEDLVAVGRFAHTSGGWHPLQPADRLAIESALARADLLDIRDRYVDELSAGERQRAFIAMALAQEPRLLLLDEPTAHLDLPHAWSFMRLIRELCRDLQLCVVMATHDLHLAASFADHFILLGIQRKLWTGTADAVFESGRLSAAYGHPLKTGRAGDTLWVRPV